MESSFREEEYKKIYSMLPQIFVSFIMFSLYMYVFHLGFYQTEEFMNPAAGKQLCHPH